MLLIDVFVFVQIDTDLNGNCVQLLAQLVQDRTERLSFQEYGCDTYELGRDQVADQIHDRCVKRLFRNKNFHDLQQGEQFLYFRFVEEQDEITFAGSSLSRIVILIPVVDQVLIFW